MKKRPLLIPRIAAVMLALCTCVCTVSLPAGIVITASAASIIPQKGAELRAHLKAHDEEFTISVDGVEAQSDDFLDKMIAEALAETGRPNDGDYIRYSILSIDCDRVSSYGTVKAFNFRIIYNCSAAQEEILNRNFSATEEKLNFAGKTDYEKVKAVYDYITVNIRYDSSDGNVAFSAYSALINRRAVCQGIAQLTYRLLMSAGVSCRIIPGCGNNGNHAWNIAKVDGNYYYIDPTWDIGNYPDSYSYFLRGSNDLDELDSLNKHSLANWPDLDYSLYAEHKSGNFFNHYQVSPVAYSKAAAAAAALGDVNSDGLVDSNDATAIMNEYASLSTTGISVLSARQRTNADVDRSGIVDSNDATLILAYYTYASTGGTLPLAEYVGTK